MSGGYESKLGNEFEKEYVVWLWLQLLGMRVHRVQWEATRGDPENGIDVWFDDDAGRVAIQCKKRDTGEWPPNEIRRVVQYAAHALEASGESAVREFRFVTNRRLSNRKLKAIDLRDTDGSFTEAELESRIQCFREFFVPDRVAEESLERLARGWRVSLQSLPDLREANAMRAADLNASAPGKPASGERLLSALRSLSSEAMGRNLDRGGLMELLPADVQGFVRDPEPTSGLARIQEHTSLFLEAARSKWPRVDGVPAHQLYIDRAEVQRVLDELSKLGGSGAVRVTGAAGAGKSNVLAEVAERLRDDGRHVLALDVSDVRRVVENHTVVDAMAALSDRSRLVLILDQLDQVLTDPSSLKDATEDVRRLMNRIGAAPCDVVLGCRRTDARTDSELDRLFEMARRDGQVAEVQIDDLHSDAVAGVLGRLGLTFSALDPALRSLIRRPLALKLFIELWSTGDVPPERSTLGMLLRVWIKRLIGSDPTLQAAFDAFIDEYRRSGLRGVSPGRITSEHDWRPLVDLGLLREAPRSGGEPVLFPAHDAVVDYRLAESLVRAAGSGALFEEIIGQPSQGLSVARRLRLATPHIAEDARGGAAALDELFQSCEIRLNLKRAVLLGLSDLGGEPTRDLVTVVDRWLNDDRWRPHVLSALMRGNENWVCALEDWFASASALVLGEEQRHLLGVLASVSLRGGDVVARILRGWMVHKPDIAGLAARVLPFDPSEDSEALFELRRELPREYQGGVPHVRWARWLRDSPSRAATWFGLQLGELSAENISSHDHGESFHGIEDAARALPAGSGSIIVDELQPIWRGLELGSLQSVEVGGTYRRPSPAVHLVSLLASAWADRIESDRLRWQEVQSSLLGDAPREQDLWLAMEVAGRLGGAATEQHEHAARWVLACERCRRLRVGLLMRSKRAIPVLEFVERALSLAKDPSLVDALEGLREEVRPLLTLIDTEAVERRIREDEDREREVRDKWGPDEWILRLLDGSQDLIWELRQGASRMPSRHLEIIKAVASREELDPGLRADLVLDASEISSLIEDGEALPDSVAVDLVGDGSLFDKDRVGDLARRVADRPVAAWQRGVIRRLERAVDEALAELLSGQAEPPSTPTSSSGLRIEALYESPAGACARALACLISEESASVQEGDVERWRGLAERLARSHSPVLRVAGVALARSLPGSGGRAAALLASEDPMACLEQTVAWPLFHCIDDDDDPRGEQALAALVRAVREFPEGFVGEAASVWMGLLGRECSVEAEVADRIFEAPNGAVEIARCLVGLSPETVEMPWVAEVIDRLLRMGAGARSASVENAVEIISRDRRGRLLTSEVVRRRIRQSEAAKRFPRLVASLFDAEGRLRDVLDLVVMTSDALAERLCSESQVNDWRLRREARETLGLLARLAEALEVEGDTVGREVVLDAIDRVVGAEPAFVMPVEIV